MATNTSIANILVSSEGQSMTDFTYMTNIATRPDYEYFIRLRSVLIQYTYQNIFTGYNSFQLISPLEGNPTTTITIQPGIGDINTIITQINSALATAGITVGTMNLTYSAYRMRCLIQLGAGWSIKFVGDSGILDFSKTPKYLHEILGFTQGTYNSLNYDSTGYLVGQYFPQVQFDYYIRIGLDQLAGLQISGNSRILETIVCSPNVTGYINTSLSYADPLLRKLDNPQRLTFKLQNEYGRPFPFVDLKIPVFLNIEIMECPAGKPANMKSTLK